MDHGESFNKQNQRWTTLHEDKILLPKLRLHKIFKLSECSKLFIVSLGYAFNQSCLLHDTAVRQFKLKSANTIECQRKYVQSSISRSFAVSSFRCLGNYQNIEQPWSVSLVKAVAYPPITTIETNVEHNDTLVVWSSSANFRLKDCVKTKHHETVVIAITLSRL